jgi:hypothetical protein
LKRNNSSSFFYLLGVNPTIIIGEKQKEGDNMAIFKNLKNWAGETTEFIEKIEEINYQEPTDNNGSFIQFGSYTDLKNKPSINGVELEGNKGLEELGIQPQGNYALEESIPVSLSQLIDDVGYLTEYIESDPTVPAYIKKITEQNIADWNAKSDFSGNYNDLVNKPNVPTVPTNLGAFNNDVGYLTEHQDLSEYAKTSDIPTKTSDLTNDSNFAVKNQNNNFSTGQTISGTLTVNGDIVQNGNSYITHAEELYTKKDEIITREGATGGLSEGAYSGIIAQKYDGENDGRLGFNANGEARVGDVGDEQPLLTRDEITNLTTGQVLVWDGTNLRAVGSDDYIKNTHYATATKPGIVGINASYGINRNTANNNLYIIKATDSDINDKTNIYKPIVPANLDYAVKSVGDGYYVKNTEYASENTAGAVKINPNYGITIDGVGSIAIEAASPNDIDGKSDHHKPITASVLDYAVGSVKASENQFGTIKVWTSTNENGEIGLNISTEG